MGVCPRCIDAEYKESEAGCGRLDENLRDVCREEAKSKQKIAMAELEYNRTGNPADANKLALAKADGAYAVAKEKCDHRSGADKKLCLKEAQAARTKAVADAQAANADLGVALPQQVHDVHQLKLLGGSHPLLAQRRPILLGGVIALQQVGDNVSRASDLIDFADSPRKGPSR